MRRLGCVCVCCQRCNVYSTPLRFLGLALQYRNRSLLCKMSTLRQSLLKVEHVCYNIKVRGREAGTLSMLADAAGGGGAAPDDDEGFSHY